LALFYHFLKHAEQVGIAQGVSFPGAAMSAF